MLLTIPIVITASSAQGPTSATAPSAQRLLWLDYFQVRWSPGNRVQPTSPTLGWTKPFAQQSD